MTDTESVDEPINAASIEASSHPLVSVIIPAFGHERWVGRTLESLIEDGYPNLEAVVIDDGSTDGTARVIGEWLDHHRQSLAANRLHLPPEPGRDGDRE